MNLEQCKTETEKALELEEIFNLLYGDIFPKHLRIEFSDKENTIVIVFNPTWKGEFTYNSPRDFKLVF